MGGDDPTIQENLLPGTDAIPRGSVQTSAFGGKTLVRYKDLKGHVMRRVIADPDAAHAQFLEWVNSLRESLKAVHPQ